MSILMMNPLLVTLSKLVELLKRRGVLSKQCALADIIDVFLESLFLYETVHVGKQLRSREVGQDVDRSGRRVVAFLVDVGDVLL
jgi:hypothetical protein